MLLFYVPRPVSGPQMLQQVTILLKISFAGMNGQPLNEYVTFAVGGLLFTLNKANIDRFPDTFLANLVKPVWKTYGEDPIVIERDGESFFLIADYIRYGVLPRDKSGRLMIDDATRRRLIVEADYFQLFDLVKECEESDETDHLPHIKNYKLVQSAIEDCKRSTESKWLVPAEVIELEHCDYDDDENIVWYQRENGAAPFNEYSKCAKLLRDVTAPLCIMGELELSKEYKESKYILYKTSTLRCQNLAELIADATQSVPHEIDLTHTTGILNLIVHSHITSSIQNYSNRYLDIRPSKILIHKCGQHSESQRDTLRDKAHIGTLVLILNSEYTGGELEVTHNGHTEVVTGPYSWVAMYGACLHKINPVTSGTRVSLVYDIYHSRTNLYRINTWKVPFYSDRPINTLTRGVDEAQKQKVIEGMHEQLRGFDSAVICLQHLYPACQANPDFLKGGDQLLYDILRDHFALAVLPCTIYRKEFNREAHDDGCEHDFCVKPWRVPALDDAQSAWIEEAANLKTNFIIFETFREEHVLHKEDLNYTGTNKEGEETVFMASGLQVRIRSA